MALEPSKLFFDGFTHKDGTGVGVLIISPNKSPTKFKHKIKGPPCSNNKYVYKALIAGLEALLELGTTIVEIRGDSELVIKKITKEYKCIKENLMFYFVVANILLRKLEYVYIKHIPRLKNQKSNDLAQISSRYKVSKEKFEELIEIRGKKLATKISPSDL